MQTEEKTLPQHASARQELAAMLARLERRQGNSDAASIETVSTNGRATPIGGEVKKSLKTPFGIMAIDRALDPESASGITANALHEVRVETGLSAACGAGFALCLGLVLASHRACEKFAGTTDETEKPNPPIAPVFWISDDYTRSEYGGFYGPGLELFGLRQEKLIRIYPQSKEDVMWAAGEIAATPGAAAFCLIEINGHRREIDLTATRRLLLRAQASGTPVILLRQSGREEASAAITRWCVEPAISTRPANAAASPLRHQFIGPPAFAVTLEKCRGGNADPSTKWLIEWNHDEQCFVSIQPSLDQLPVAGKERPAKPGRGGSRSNSVFRLEKSASPFRNTG